MNFYVIRLYLIQITQQSQQHGQTIEWRWLLIVCLLHRELETSCQHPSSFTKCTAFNHEHEATGLSDHILHAAGHRIFQRLARKHHCHWTTLQLQLNEQVYLLQESLRDIRRPPKNHLPPKNQLTNTFDICHSEKYLHSFELLTLGHMTLQCLSQPALHASIEQKGRAWFAPTKPNHKKTPPKTEPRSSYSAIRVLDINHWLDRPRRKKTDRLKDRPANKQATKQPPEQTSKRTSTHQQPLTKPASNRGSNLPSGIYHARRRVEASAPRRQCPRNGGCTSIKGVEHESR